MTLEQLVSSFSPEEAATALELLKAKPVTPKQFYEFKANDIDDLITSIIGLKDTTPRQREKQHLERAIVLLEQTKERLSRAVKTLG